MTRQAAFELLRKELNKWGLKDWSIRQNQNPESHFLGLCSYRDKCIILSAHHIDIHPDLDIVNTIRHEVAHALVGPGHAHDDVWAAKAKEVGCDNTLPCSNLSLSPEIIDAIRSGADVEITFDEHIIRTPKYHVTRLQDKCEKCGKVAVVKSEQLIKTLQDDQPDIKLVMLECGHPYSKKIPKGTPFHNFQFGGDPACPHKWAKNTCTTCGRKRPYEFQLEGMRALEIGLASQNGFGLFHEMGLGKTIMAGGYLKFHPEALPALWVVKSSLKYQTAVFLVNWCGNDHVPQIINSSKDYLFGSDGRTPKMKHYIVGYDMLVPKSRTLKNGTVVQQGFDISAFDKIGIKTIILDECQQIKNVDSSRTQQVRRLVSPKDQPRRKVIGLSGTPWNNRGSELFPIYNMIDPQKFNSEAGFKRNWVKTYWDGRYEKEGGIKNIPAFKEYTKGLSLRRERSEVLPELPTTNRTKLNIKMDAEQESVYDDAVSDFVKWYEEQVGEISGMMIIAAMQKMRHLVAIAKIPATLEYVDEFVEDTDRKLCVFAHHKDVQAILFEELKKKYGDQMPVLQINAEMNGLERHQTCVKFNESPRCLMVASQLASGEGLNLQTCCDCIMHERQWNPGKEEQCEGRFVRIGAVSTSVNAVYAHLDGLTTIDPKLDEIVERKRMQFNDWTGAEQQGWSENALMKELAETIVRAHKSKKKGKAA